MVGYKLNPVGARVNHWFQGRVVIWFQGINLLSHEGNSRAGHRMELVNEGNNLVHEVLVELVYSSGFPFMKEDTNRRKEEELTEGIKNRLERKLLSLEIRVNHSFQKKENERM